MGSETGTENQAIELEVLAPGLTVGVLGSPKFNFLLAAEGFETHDNFRDLVVWVPSLDPSGQC